MCLNESHSKVREGEHLYNAFRIQNGVKQSDTLRLLFLTFLQNMQWEVKKNSTTNSFWSKQMMFIYWVKNINTIKKSTQTHSVARKEASLQVNAEKTYVYVHFWTPSYNTKSLCIKAANKSLKTRRRPNAW